MGAGEPVRLVLESDGTQVEDGEYWRTLPPNTVLLLLRPGQRWLPTGADVIRAGQYGYRGHVKIVEDAGNEGWSMDTESV